MFIYIYIYICVCVYIYIIIMSCRQHRHPWPSLATPAYCSSLLAGPQGYVPYPQWAAVCWFELIDLLLFGHMRGSIRHFFMWALLLIVHTWNSSPLQSNLLWLQCTYCTVPTTSGRPHGSPLVWACQWPFISSIWTWNEFSRVYDNFKCPHEKSLETYRMHLVHVYIYIYIYIYTGQGI